MKTIICFLISFGIGYASLLHAQSLVASIEDINQTLELTGWHEYGQKVEFISTCYLTNTVYYKNHGTREIYHLQLKELKTTVDYDDKLVTFQCSENKNCIKSVYENRSFPDWLSKAYFVLEFNSQTAAKRLSEAMVGLINNCQKDVI